MWCRTMLLGRGYFLFAVMLTILALGTGMVMAGEGAVEAQQGYIDWPEYVQSPLLKQPPQLTPEQEEEINRWEARFPLSVPTPIDPSARLDLIQPTCPPSEPGSATSDTKRLPGDFMFFRNNPLNDVATDNMTSIVNEPTVGVSGNVVFYAGNWYASVSGDGGNTFSYIDPRDNFPADGTPDPVNGGFCCDQVVYHDKLSGSTFWGILYSPDTAENIIRIAVASTETDLLTNSWFIYDFTMAMSGSLTGQFFDFIELTASDSSLYLTANIHDVNTLTFNGSLIARLPITPMSQGIGFGFSYLKIPDKSSLRCTHGADTIMYWGTHNSNTEIRIYRWTEGSNTVSWNDVTHGAYGTGAMTPAPGPDGRDWVGRADDRILGAWVADSIIGFMWNSPPAGAFPLPFVVIKQFNQSDRSLVGEPAVWSTDEAWLYPSVHPNARGDIAGTICVGGGGVYPQTQAWISDDDNLDVLAPLRNFLVIPGTSGPASNSWGDYLTSRCSDPFSNTWSATAFSLQGGPNNSNVEPRYLWFGRERDCPVLSPPTIICTPLPGTIQVDWNQVVGATQYCLYRDGGFVGCFTDTSWVDINPMGVQHCYTVTAQTADCPPSVESVQACCTALPPINDDCSSCLVVRGPVTDFGFSTNGATTDGVDDPGACGFTGNNNTLSDVWFCWTALCNSDVTVSLCGSDFDTKMSVYDGDAGCVPATASIACNDDWCGLQSEVTFPAEEGRTYLIRVGGFGGAQGLGLLNISISNTQVVCPAGSMLENEPCGTDVNGGCNSAPEVYSDLYCGVPVCGTVWYDPSLGLRDTDWYLKTFDVTTTVHWSAETEFPVQLHIIDLTAGCIPIVDVEFALGEPCGVTTVSALLAPGTYAFFIAPLFNDTLLCVDGPWDYVAWLTCNDDCDGCQPLIGDVTDVPFSTFGATTDGPDEPAACNFFAYTQIDSDVWFCWTAGCDGDVLVSVCGSEFDTKLAVYEDFSCPPPLGPIACNEDACGLQSEVVFTAIGGTVYRIRVGGYFGQRGNGVISITTLAGSPANDDCSAAIPLSGTIDNYPFITCGASTDGLDEPVDCDFLGYTQIDSDVWFLYTPECDGNVTVDLCGSNYDTKVAIYKNQACPPVGTMVCNDDFCGTEGLQSEVTVPMVASSQYLIRIGGFHGAQGEGLLNITNDGPACCSCPLQGDGDGSGFIDGVDVQYAIDVVFFGLAEPHDPMCPSGRFDVNCDGFPDSVDIQYLIDHVFSNGIPPCDPCAGP